MLFLTEFFFSVPTVPTRVYYIFILLIYIMLCGKKPVGVCRYL